MIVGRSNIVGKPMAALLMQDAEDGNCTVTVCHRHTRDLADRCREADVSGCLQTFWMPPFSALQSYAPATTLFPAHSCEAMPTCRLSWPSWHWVSLLPHRP